MNADLIAFLQWLVNQGASVAIALLVLWRLDGRLASLDKTAADLAAASRQLAQSINPKNGSTTAVPSK